MNQEELDSRIKAALVKMHVYERPHNRISYIHTKEILQLLFECAPVDEKDFKGMLKISIGISSRYIEEYLNGLRLWGIIWREEGTIYIEKPNITSKEIKEEIRQKEIIKNSELKIKMCIKNSFKAMTSECTIEKCKVCDGS